MSAASTLANAASVDWNILAAAAATFVVTGILTWQGFKKGKRNVEAGKSEITPIVGASMIESSSMVRLADALHENTICLRENTAELRRGHDIDILTARK